MGRNVAKVYTGKFGKSATRKAAVKKAKEEGWKAAPKVVQALKEAMALKRKLYRARLHGASDTATGRIKGLLEAAVEKAGFGSVAEAKQAARAFGCFDKARD